ncbi:MAG: glycosyltransferase family 8 protein [Candidatus Velthaea sp.]
MFVAGCRETISIVTACDDGYAQHAHVLVESMVSNNPDHDFRVFVLVPAGFRYAERLDQLESHPNCQIRLIEIDPNLVRDLHVSEHIPHAAYFRLLIDDVLPRDLQRVLYFDADIVIAGDVLPLWQIDLDDNIVAAVADATPDEGQERRRRVVLTGGLTYYNSGVMLIDLDRWREEQVTKKALAFCRAHPERLKYWAQCALNYVLAGDVLSLNVIWNFQNSHVESEAVEDASSSLLRAARIVHFTALKPWFARCRHPLAFLYWEFLKKTPWSDYVPPDRAANAVARRFRRIIPSFGRATAAQHP